MTHGRAEDETDGDLSRENSLLPEELANQGVRLKEEQLRREEEKVIVYRVRVCVAG